MSHTMIRALDNELNSWIVKLHMDTTVLVEKQGYMDHLVKDSINIWLHHDNFNRDKEFTVTYSTHLPTNRLQWGRANKRQSNQGWMTAENPG